MLNRLMLTNCICFYGHYVCGRRKAFLKKQVLQQRTVFSFYIQANLVLLTVGLDNNLKSAFFQMQLALDIFCYSFLKSHQGLDSFSFNC